MATPPSAAGSSSPAWPPVPGGRDEIHGLAATMNDMLDRLDEHQRSIRRFTADAGHELTSPMANIEALVETTDPDTVEWAALQARLVAESERAAALVDDLLSWRPGTKGRRLPHHPPAACRPYDRLSWTSAPRRSR